MKKNENWLKLAGVLILISWIIYSQISKNKNYDNLRINHSFSSATIKSIESKPKTWDSFFCNYFFKIERDTITGFIVKDFTSRELLFLRNKKFPVIYEVNNFKNNKMLIYKEDFDYYDLEYPDSLKWICDSLKIDKCK